MSRTVELLVGEILGAIELVQLYTRDQSFESFVANPEKQDAVVRRLSIIGEAVKSIPDDFRDRYPAIPWRGIAGMRDVMVHEYFRIDLDLAWEMVQVELPLLATRIRAIMRSEGFGTDSSL